MQESVHGSSDSALMRMNLVASPPTSSRSQERMPKTSQKSWTSFETVSLELMAFLSQMLLDLAIMALLGSVTTSIFGFLP